MKKIKFGFIAGFCLTLFCNPSFAGLKDAQEVFKSGDWKVLRSIDAMKDSVDCTGIYKSDYNIQLTDDSLFIKISGGIEGITFRYDNLPPEPLRLATKLEKDIRSLIIEGSDFDKLTHSSRLRLQVSTVLGRLVEQDISLNGLQDALANIKNNCPIPESNNISNVKIDTKELTDQKANASNACSDELIVKMKSLKLKPSLIKAICN